MARLTSSAEDVPEVVEAHEWVTLPYFIFFVDHTRLESTVGVTSSGQAIITRRGKAGARPTIYVPGLGWVCFIV